MASTSVNPSRWKNEVFISYRGADIRQGFLSHLCEVLCRKQIITFTDENLDRGEEIEPALLHKIEESQVSVVIFSENYAYSSWCLDELVKIMDCEKEMGQAVVPVFYQIDPTHVQELTGSYGDALVKHGERFKDKVETWSLALKQTARMSGFVSLHLKPESKLIYAIIDHIFERLNKAFPEDPCDDGLVGIESQLKDVESLLHLEATDVRFVGIWGMGGIGKTTLAGKVFDCFSCLFQAQCFIANVREQLERCTMIELQEKILSKLLGKENLDVGLPIMSSSSIRKWIIRKKVLIVLDDVWDLDVVEFLVGKPHIYAPGSRIVITSRDKGVLNNAGADIYQVNELNDDDALQLFSLHAFKQNSPPEAFTEAARKSIVYAGGNPLALKVLGSNLYGKSVVECEDQLKKLENVPNNKIAKILKISYDELDEDEKEIFLDISCFFDSQDKEHVESMLESCFDRSARIGISCLLDKCLINISGNMLEMHDLLRQMGKDIVRMECAKSPGKRSRLWNPQDIYHVLSKDMGSISIESMSSDITRIGIIRLSPTIFVKMSNLRFLKFYHPYYDENSPYQHNRIQGNVHLCEAGLSFLPDKLRYLHWHNYPLKSLPSKFFPDKLVELHLTHSHVEQLCNEHQCLENLKVLDLSYSINLVLVPDLSLLPKLEVLRLRGCISLVEICLSVQYHNKLSHLDLQNCNSLCSLPNFVESTNLDFLFLEGCSKLAKFPKFPGDIRRLNLSATAILEAPPSLGYQSFLTELLLKSCTKLESLPSSIGELKCLEVLNLEGCTKFRELTRVPCNIKYLILKETAIQEVPSSIGNSSLLVHLDLCSCRRLKSLPSSIGELKCLKLLYLEGCLKLKSLPDELCNLKALEFFDVSNCINLNELPENFGNLESLWLLYASGSGLKKLPLSINSLRRLLHLDCTGCTELILPPLTGLVGLQTLYLNDCGMTEISICKGSLVSLRALFLSENLLERLPTSIDSLVSLKVLYLSGNSLEQLPTSIGSLVSLEELHLGGNLLETLPTSIEQISELIHLDLNDCKRLKCLPKLPSLGVLTMANCTSLESMVAAWNIDGNRNNCIPCIDASNCMNLEVKTCRNLMDELLARIEYCSRQLKFEDFLMELPFIRGSCIPGDDVPQQMKYRNNNGSFLQCLLRPDPLDFMVLTFCAVLAPNQHCCSDLGDLECEYNLESDYGQFIHSHSIHHLCRWKIKCSATHVLLWHSTIRINSRNIWKKASFRFNVRGEGGLGPAAVVIKCGVHLFYHDTDIDSPSFQPKDWNPEIYSFDCNKMTYGSTEAEARENCDICGSTLHKKKRLHVSNV